MFCADDEAAKKRAKQLVNGPPTRAECYGSGKGELIRNKKNVSPSEAVMDGFKANALSRAHDTFWRKSHPCPMTLKSIACANYPWITFAKPTTRNKTCHHAGAQRTNLRSLRWGSPRLLCPCFSK